MSPREHDPELRDLISAGDALHEQLARLDRSEPPEELDRIIIERARQAIRVPQSERPIRQLHWVVPIGLAATLLVSFALVFHQVSPQPATPAPTAATKQREADEYTPVAARTRAESAGADQAVDSRLLATQELVASKAPPAAAISPPAERQRAPAAESVASATSARAIPDTALEERETFARVTVTGSAAVENNATEPAAADDAAKGLVDSAQRAGAPATRSKSEAKGDFRSDPDAWMAYIGRLRHLGRAEEADRELADFRRVFPHRKYAAPPEAPAERPVEAIAPEK